MENGKPVVIGHCDRCGSPVTLSGCVDPNCRMSDIDILMSPNSTVVITDEIAGGFGIAIHYADSFGVWGFIGENYSL